MKKKNLLRNFLTGFLTIGASLTLGLLSFSGTFILTANVPLAIGLASSAFVLSTMYEGQIYMKNIKNSLKKLFFPSFMKQEIAGQCLKELMKQKSSNDEDMPPLFTDYIKLQTELKELKEWLKKQEKKDKQAIKRYSRPIKLIEKWFANNFVQHSQVNANSDYLSIFDWIQQNKLNDHLFNYQEKYQHRKKILLASRIFSFAAGAFMGLGTAYLLAEPLTVIPFIAALAATPATAIPLFIGLSSLTVLAGAAYALLTYNCISDLVQRESIQNGLKEIKNLFSETFSWKKLGKVIVIMLLLASSIALTLCTAGTWLTIAQTGRPFFNALKTITTPIMLFINPIVMAISAGAFNVANTCETCEEISGFFKKEKEEENEEKDKSKNKEGLTSRMRDKFVTLKKKENLGQILNPFRILLILTFSPLRVLLFLGHLASIGATADRVLNIPEMLTLFVIAFTEMLEDFHYFTGNKLDIPTRILKIGLSPLFILSATWNFFASMANSETSGKKAFPFSFEGFFDACKKAGFFIFDYLKKEDKEENGAVINFSPSSQRIICQQMIEDSRKKEAFNPQANWEMTLALNNDLPACDNIKEWLESQRNKKHTETGTTVYNERCLTLFDKIENRLCTAPPASASSETDEQTPVASKV